MLLDPRSKEEEIKEAVDKLIDETFVKDLQTYDGPVDQFVDELIFMIRYSLGLVTIHYDEGILNDNDNGKGDAK
nr:hypothetical transcript [Hymenolepis microstoma]